MGTSKSGLSTPRPHLRIDSFRPILGRWDFLRCHQATAEEGAAIGPLRTGARQADLLTALCCPPAPPPQVEGPRSRFLTKPLPRRGLGRLGSFRSSAWSPNLQAFEPANTAAGGRRMRKSPTGAGAREECLRASARRPPCLLWGPLPWTVLGQPLISRVIYLKQKTKNLLARLLRATRRGGHKSVKGRPRSASCAAWRRRPRGAGCERFSVSGPRAAGRGRRRGAALGQARTDSQTGHRFAVSLAQMRATRATLELSGGLNKITTQIEASGTEAKVRVSALTLFPLAVCLALDASVAEPMFRQREEKGPSVRVGASLLHLLSVNSQQGRLPGRGTGRVCSLQGVETGSHRGAPATPWSGMHPCPA